MVPLIRNATLTVWGEINVLNNGVNRKAFVAMSVTYDVPAMQQIIKEFAGQHAWHSQPPVEDGNRIVYKLYEQNEWSDTILQEMRDEYAKKVKELIDYIHDKTLLIAKKMNDISFQPQMINGSRLRVAGKMDLSGNVEAFLRNRGLSDATLEQYFLQFSPEKLGDVIELGR